MYRPHRTIAAIALSTALLATACGDDGTTATSEPSDAVADDPVVGDGTSAEALMSAGELRAILTSHLQEHVYLSGIVVETLADVGSDRDDPDAAAALARCSAHEGAWGEGRHGGVARFSGGGGWGRCRVGAGGVAGCRWAGERWVVTRCLPV